MCTLFRRKILLKTCSVVFYPYTRQKNSSLFPFICTSRDIHSAAVLFTVYAYVSTTFVTSWYHLRSRVQSSRARPLPLEILSAVCIQTNSSPQFSYSSNVGFLHLKTRDSSLVGRGSIVRTARGLGIRLGLVIGLRLSR